MKWNRQWDTRTFPVTDLNPHTPTHHYFVPLFQTKPQYYILLYYYIIIIYMFINKLYFIYIWEKKHISVLERETYGKGWERNEQSFYTPQHCRLQCHQKLWFQPHPSPTHPPTPTPTHPAFASSSPTPLTTSCTNEAAACSQVPSVKKIKCPNKIHTHTLHILMHFKRNKKDFYSHIMCNNSSNLVWHD